MGVVAGHDRAIIPGPNNSSRASQFCQNRKKMRGFCEDIFHSFLPDYQRLSSRICSPYSTGMQFAIIYPEMKTINAQTCMAEVRLAA
jgi:hypothetical protein